MKTKPIVLLAIVLGIIFLVDITYSGFITTDIDFDEFEEATIVRVIDGDTVVLDNGERVRLLGIDTPERGQFLYQESTDYLVERVEGKKVFLAKGPEDRDKYDRLLRYIYIDNNLVNIELVEKGLATAYIFDEGELTDEIIQAELQAKENKLGIWSHEPDTFCITLHNFHYNAKGNDNENLNNEYVTFRNKCTEPKEITDWVVFDAKNTIFRFPKLILENKTTVTLFSGEGTNTQDSLYWGLTQAVWNNDGDKLTMLDQKGNKILEHIY